MKLNKLIDILVALRDSGAVTQGATVYVQGCGEAFELEEVKVTLFSEEMMETSIILSDGTIKIK